MKKNPQVTQLIPGGAADGMDFDDFDQQQLARGAEVELEHVRAKGKTLGEQDRALAKEIAADHLAEIPDYYTWLLAMEKMAEKAGVLKKNPARAWENVQQKTVRVRAALNRAPVHVQLRIAQQARRALKNPDKRSLTKQRGDVEMLQDRLLREARERAELEMAEAAKARRKKRAIPAVPAAEKDRQEKPPPERLWPIADWYIPHLRWLKARGAGSERRIAEAVAKAALGRPQYDPSSYLPKQADLHGMDLSGDEESDSMDLSGLDLQGVIFGDANLTGVNFASSILDGADLREATLSGAQFPRASLRGAKFRGHLQMVNFERADLSGASFYEVRLDFCSLVGATLFEADLSYADLSTSNLSWARVVDAGMRSARLPPPEKMVGAHVQERKPVASYAVAPRRGKKRG